MPGLAMNAKEFNSLVLHGEVTAFGIDNVLYVTKISETLWASLGKQ